jgi:hypothetical protein
MPPPEGAELPVIVLFDLYHFDAALGRVNSTDTISFYGRPFRPALNDDRAALDFFLLQQ